MGLKTIKFSDFSQKEITEKNSVRIMLTYNEPGSKIAIVADASVKDEIVQLIETHGKQQARRGRRAAVEAVQPLDPTDIPTPEVVVLTQA